MHYAPDRSLLELSPRFSIVGPLRHARPPENPILSAARLAAGALVLSAPLFAKPVITLDASREGHRADAVFWYTTIAAGVAFALVVAALAVLLARYRRSRSPKAAYETGAGRGARTLTLALAGLVFVVIDLNLVRMSKRDMNEYLFAFPSGPDVVRVEVMPQQWAWNVRYPGPNGAFGDGDDVVALNEMRVPVNRPVMLNLMSKDVVHSFYVPNFRLKHDANPGFVTRAWFTATRTGRYEIACSQVCGWAHYLMKGTLIVLPEDEWRAWTSDAEADAARRFDPADREAQWGWTWVP